MTGVDLLAFTILAWPLIAAALYAARATWHTLTRHHRKAH